MKIETCEVRQHVMRLRLTLEFYNPLVAPSWLENNVICHVVVNKSENNNNKWSELRALLRCRERWDHTHTHLNKLSDLNRNEAKFGSPFGDYCYGHGTGSQNWGT